MWMKCPFFVRYFLGLGEETVSKTAKTLILIRLLLKKSIDGWGGEREEKIIQQHNFK